MGAGKTTFYEAHLKETFPIVIPPIRHQRDAMLRERRSFAVEDLTVDTALLESARQAGYAVDASEKRSHSGRCWTGPVIHSEPAGKDAVGTLY